MGVPPTGPTLVRGGRSRPARVDPERDARPLDNFPVAAASRGPVGPKGRGPSRCPAVPRPRPAGRWPQRRARLAASRLAPPAAARRRSLRSLARRWLVAGSRWPSPPVGCFVRAAVRVAAFVLLHRRPARRAGPGSRGSSSASASARAAVVDARGRHRTPGSRCPALEALFYGLLGAARAAAAAAARLAAVGGRGLGRRWRCCAAAGRSAACPGAGWPSPSWTPRSPPRCRTSARPASASCSPCSATLLAWLVAARGRGRRRRRRGSSRRSAGRCWPPCPRCAPWRRRRPTARSRVAAVQGNVPGDGTTSSPTTARSPSNHVRRDRRAGRRGRRRRGRRSPDFVVWPENSTAIDPFADPQIRAGIEAARRRRSACRSWSGRSSTAGPDARAQPGHRLGPGDRRRRPLHQAAPGAVRRVHPVPRRSSAHNFGQLDHDPARHGRAAPAPSRCDVGRRAGRPTRSASTSPTTTGSTPRSPTAPSWSWCRPATRRSSTPARSSSSSRSPGCGRSRPAATSWSPPPTASPGIIAPDGTSWPTGRRRAPRAVLDGRVGLDDALTPAIADRAVAGRGCAAGRRSSASLLRAARRIVGAGDGATGRRRRRTRADPRRAATERATREPTRTSVPTLGRVVMVVPTYNEADNLAWIVGRLRAAAARRRRARRRRQLARRHRRDRRRARRRRPAGHGAAPHREGRPRRGVPRTASGSRSTPATT